MMSEAAFSHSGWFHAGKTVSAGNLVGYLTKFTPSPNVHDANPNTYHHMLLINRRNGH